jgi:hypothetical protein
MLLSSLGNVSTALYNYWLTLPPVLGTMWAYQSNHSELYIYGQLSLYVGTAYVATTLSVNLLVTSLIITRLLLYRRAALKALPAGHTNQYVSIVTIVVESILLYSFFAIAFIVTYALDNPMNRVFVYMGSAFQVRRPLVIQTRCNGATAFAANRGLHDYIKSRARTRVDIQHAGIEHGIFTDTFQPTGFHHPRRR